MYRLQVLSLEATRWMWSTWSIEESEREARAEAAKHGFARFRIIPFDYFNGLISNQLY